MVPVIDLLARFGCPPSQITRRTCTVILELQSQGERQDVGVTVDTVNEVVEIPAADIEPAPAFGTKIRADFIAGMAKLNGQFVIVFDIGKVLSFDDMAVLSGLGGAAEASA